MIVKPWPSCPFEELAADLCYHGGQCYLIVVDCYTDWPTIGKNINATDSDAPIRDFADYPITNIEIYIIADTDNQFDA